MSNKINIYGLGYNCPHLERQVKCLLKLVEYLPFIEKVKWIDSLSDKEKETILEHHQVCSKNR